MKFPGSIEWHIQLSERPAVIFDVRTVTVDGREVLYLAKGYPTSAAAEEAIGSLVKDWDIQAGEWRC